MRYERCLARNRWILRPTELINVAGCEPKTRVCLYTWFILTGQKPARVNYSTRLGVLSLLIDTLPFAAGCLRILGEDDSPRGVNRIVVNQETTYHPVVVETRDDSGVVYSDGQTHDAESDLTMTQFNQTGEYEVGVTVDRNTTTIRHTFRSKDRLIPVINIGIDTQGTMTVE